LEHWELVARESVRDLVARYNANGDSGRFDEVLALFADDATMELPGELCRGVVEIRAMFERAARRTGTAEGSRARFVRHFTATHQIDVLDERRARGRCYYAVLTDRGLDHWGRYVDEYRLLDAAWRFAHRKVTIDGTVPGAWAAE
jgi:3-phenylpropionate/cinnamic acid dioxygenase small subunit